MELQGGMLGTDRAIFVSRLPYKMSNRKREVPERAVDATATCCTQSIHFTRP